MNHEMPPGGENSAKFVSLLTNLQPALRSFIVTLIPGHPDIDDVLQKTNLVLWNKRNDFMLGTNFRAWALTVARFEVMAHLKSLKRQPCFVFDDELLGRLATDSERTESSNERLEALDHCLGKLRAHDRELLDHRYRRRGGLEQFARVRGRSVSALSVTLFRLRVTLRRCIADALAGKGGPA